MPGNPLIAQAIKRIPAQLRREDFRFVPIWSGEKRPFEKGWNVPGSKTNYKYDDPKLAAFLLEGHNWGTCTGFGGLIIFDSDHSRLAELGILDKLPYTFMVRTGGGGTHRYFICHDIKEKVIMYDTELKDSEGKPAHLGEIQTLGFQAVGPGSLHPNNKRYVLENDAPIAEIAWLDLYNILDGKIEFGLGEPHKKKKHFAVRISNPMREDPFDNVRIEDVLYPKGNIIKRGSIIKGSHPLHGSKGGCNFQIDTKENTWFCYRDWHGGGPALAIAMAEGILRCSDWGKGGSKKLLTGDLFIETLKAAEARGYIKKRAPLMHIERWEE